MELEMEQAKIIALMKKIAEADGVVSQGEKDLIENLRQKLNVTFLEIKAYTEMGIEELIDDLDADSIKKFRIEFSELAKSDGIVDLDELKVFNKIQEKIYPG
jgi:uncharacterized tellurite resistance protein B-like protein